MDWRRVQEIRSGTKLISLPKSWVEENQIKKGDFLVLRQIDPWRLLVYPAKIMEERLQITIKESSLVRREILAAYLSGYDVIKVVSPNESTPLQHKKTIRSLSRELVGLEVLSESATEMEMHFLITGETNLNPWPYLVQAFRISRNMKRDAFDSLLEGKENLATEVITRDDEVNRLYFLIVRILKSMLRELELSPSLQLVDLLDWRMLAAYAEDLGDSAALTAAMALKHASLLRQRPFRPWEEALRHLHERLLNLIDDVLTAFKKKDPTLAQELKSSWNESLLPEVESLSEEMALRLTPPSSTLLPDVKRHFMKIGHLAEDVSDLVT